MTNAIVPGSLSAITQTTGRSLSESFLSADAILIVDMSGSMGMRDAPGGKSRFDAAEAEVIRLQAQHPGKIAIVSFSDHATFSPSGRPERMGGGTNMAGALNYIQPADDTGTKFILISDGQPDDPEKTLRIARQFKTPIQTIFIGPESDYSGGRAFLEKLARETGGAALKSNAPGLLAPQVEKLLLGEGK